MQKILTTLAVLLAVALPATALARDFEFFGVLEEGDETQAYEGALAAYTDTYTVTLGDGEEIRIFLEMTDTKPHLTIHDEDGVLLEKDIAGGVDHVMQKDWKAPRAGTFRIVVTTAYQERQAYKLVLSELPPGTMQ